MYEDKIYDSEFETSVSGSESNIYLIKKNNKFHQDKKKFKCSPLINGESSSSSVNDPEEFASGFIIPTVPYKANDNYGLISEGNLVFVDPDGEVRSLYKVPTPQKIGIFEGLRFICSSYSLDRFKMIRTKNVVLNIDTIATKVIFEQINNDGISVNDIELDDITGTNANYAIDSFENISYIIGNNRLWAIGINNQIMLNVLMPFINNELIHVIAARERSFYTAGVITIDSIFHNISLDRKIGYIVHMQSNGSLFQLVAIKADNLTFRGMYYYNQRLYITGSYKGQMYITKPLSKNKPKFTDVDKISVNMCDTTSFIMGFDENIGLVWWRLLVSNNPNCNVIGDITCNKNNQIFTTCRFKGNLGLSEYNSMDIDKTINRDDEAFVLIGLTGEIARNCPRIVPPRGIPNKPISWWRMIPAGFPANTVTNYISIANNDYDIAISAYSDVSLFNKYMLNNHYFVAGFTPKLDDLYYYPIIESLNIYNSRIISLSTKTLFTGSTAWNNIYVYPFGMIKEFNNQIGYYITFSLDFPKLIGIVISKEEDIVNVQFSGYTSIYQDAVVGRNYYISCADTTQIQPKLTANPAGCINIRGILNGARYYGTAIKDGIIYINNSNV